MNPFISSSLSALFLLTAIAPVVAQTPESRPGRAGETDQGIPGVTNQSRPGDPDQGGTNNQGVPAFPNQTVPNSPNENRNNVPNLTVPNADDRRGVSDEIENRPGRAGETDQGIPGVTDQSRPGDPDQGGANNQGVPAFPNQSPSSDPDQRSLDSDRTPYVGLNSREAVSQFQPNPFELVNLARNGYLEGAGIPQGLLLTIAYNQRELTAEEVIQGAISLNRLNASFLEDEGYVFAVRRHLENLTRPTHR